jgi:hypothetical protein
MPHFGELRNVAVSTPTFLLDGFSTGVWTALALVRLIGAYTGPLIRVRRNSDNTELDIGYTATGVLDSAALLAFVGANSGYVVKFYDQSGAGNHFVQATAGKQPRIVATGVFDNQLVFDAVDDCLTSANPSGTPSAFSVFLKGNIRAIGSTQIILEQGATFPQAGHRQFMYYNTGGVGNATGADVSQDAANYFENFYNTIVTHSVHGIVADRSLATQVLETKLWLGGILQARWSGATTGALPNGNFTSETWNLGARNNGATLAASLDLSLLVIFETEKSADAAVISSFL